MQVGSQECDYASLSALREFAMSVLSKLLTLANSRLFKIYCVCVRASSVGARSLKLATCAPADLQSSHTNRELASRILRSASIPSYSFLFNRIQPILPLYHILS